MSGTLTLSNYNSAHTSSFTIILYKSCAVATFEHSGPLLPINYVCIVAFAPNSQRASFYSVTMSLHYSTTIKLLPLTILILGSYLSLRALLRWWEVIISIVSAVARKSKYPSYISARRVSRHAGRDGNSFLSFALL